MSPKIFIETPRLVLREWIDDDALPFVTLNSDKTVMAFFPSVRSAGETMEQIQRISKHIAEYGYGFFALERKDNGRFIGFTGLSHPGFEAAFTPCVEIGWRLSMENWGQGFATEAGKACLEFGFDTLGLDEIYSFTAVQNKPSEKVMQRIGMVKKGYFDHPSIDNESELKNHVLYSIKNPDMG